MKVKVTLLCAMLLIVYASCHGRSGDNLQDVAIDAGTDLGADLGSADESPPDTDTATTVDSLLDGADDGVVGTLDGCLGGTPVVRVETVRHAPPALELSAADERLACCNETFCCLRSDGLRITSFRPVGEEDWQMTAELPICCLGPISQVLVRINGSGSIRWMRTTCYQDAGSIYGSQLVDAIPLANGHLAIYRVAPPDLTTRYTLELKYLNADGAIAWALSGEAIGNAIGLRPLRLAASERAAFIGGTETAKFFMSVSPSGEVKISPLPENFGGSMTDLPDIPEENGYPLLLDDREDDGFRYTARISFTRLDPDGKLAVSKSIGTWKGRFGVTSVWASQVGPGASGYLITINDNSTGVWELVRLDGTGDRIWTHKGPLDSPEWDGWTDGTLQSFFAQPNGEVLVVGTSRGGTAPKFPYRGILSADGSRFHYVGPFDLPLATRLGWSMDSIRQVGNRWTLVGRVKEPSATNDSGPTDAAVAIYDSEFRLVHAGNYGVPGSDFAMIAQRGDTWGLAIKRSGPTEKCSEGDVLDWENSNTSFLRFEGVCE